MSINYPEAHISLYEKKRRKIECCCSSFALETFRKSWIGEGHLRGNSFKQNLFEGVQVLVILFIFVFLDLLGKYVLTT